MDDNLSILCRWFDNNNSKQNNKDTIFLKSKTLGINHIFIITIIIIVIIKIRTYFRKDM
jgi:hypothetical protein